MNNKRIFDIALSLIALLLLLPVLLLLAVLVQLNSPGPSFYAQERVGRLGRCFRLLKFRTMHCRNAGGSLLTIGMRDSRITSLGYYLRKYKIDEFPQLLNVLKGDMSIVGPRPEVSKYVALYNTEQLNVLTVRPGMTDWASICFFDENRLLEEAADPEEYYVQQILPVKLSFNLQYIRRHNLTTDLRIIFLTGKRMLAIPRQQHPLAHASEQA
ncbi:glycosyl transferase [Pedobacter yulinensis]|uniref:Glycosyl transferase n=1 Tax=Pedobacter yulinensis TaxID=2126353 RepID=A0A2T3HLD4_9SPHI|nr:sugar transferase [Pedobacter yulinensis]PST83257.1 glycosyl transferase [Pedobacter yulinensis]